MMRWPTPKRNTALSDLLVRYAKAAQAGPRTIPQKWAQSYSAAVGLDPKVAEVSQSTQPAAADRADRRGDRPPNRSSPTCSPSPGSSPIRPTFANWVDRRYTDALNPLLISTD